MLDGASQVCAVGGKAAGLLPQDTPPAAATRQAPPAAHLFTSKQIAQALRVSERAVQRRAERCQWPHQIVREGRSRSYVYRLADLPADVQARVALAYKPNASQQRPNRKHGGEYSWNAEQLDAAWSRYERVPQKLKDEALRRAGALMAIERLTDGGMPLQEARHVVATQLGQHPSALARWAAKVRGAPRDCRCALLVPEYCGRTATAEIQPEAWDAFKADWLRPEAPAATACYDRLRRLAASRGWSIPSIRTFCRRIDREIPRPVQLLARKGEEALMRSFPAQERDKSVFHALEAVNADGHRFDVFVEWPDGTIARPTMVAFQDLYSAKLLSHRISQTESSDLVRLAFGDLVHAYGIPSATWLDNGRGFAAKLLTGGTPTRYRFKVRAEDPEGLFTALGVNVHWATPYHGQAKPIERAFRDLCETVAKHPAFAGAYTGNNPTAKPENYRSRAVPLATFVRVVGEEIAAHNARVGRRSKVAAGRSFDQVFAESFSQSTIRRATADQRRLWLLAAEGVSASRQDGSVHLLGNRYWTEALSQHAGQRVVVRFDPDHLHGSVHCYSLAGTYIGEAECVMSVGFADTGAGREHARAKKQYRRAAKDMLDAERRMQVAQLADQLPGGAPPELPTPAVIEGTFGRRRNPAPAVRQAAAATGTDDGRARNLDQLLQRIQADQIQRSGWRPPEE